MKKFKNFKLNIKPKAMAKWHKQVLSVLTAFVLLFTSMPVADMSKLASSVITKFSNLISSADETYSDSISDKINNNTYTVNSKDDLIKLYNSDPSEYQNITIHFAMTTAFGSNDFESFDRGLGNEKNPFKGKVTLNQGTDLILYLNHALFDYIDDSAELCKMTLIRKDENQEYPLLAENVVHTTDLSTPKTWTVKKDIGTDSTTSNKTNYSFAGVIGTMKENSILDLSFDNSVDNTADETNNKNWFTVKGANAGLACGTMEKNSKLTFSFQSAKFNVEATENAGSIVGKMEENSVFTLSKTYTYQGIIKGKNAGGLVGKMTDASIEMADNVSVPTYNCTVYGSSSAGGIFGVYSFSNSDYLKEYDLTKWSASNNSMFASGNAVLGGYFGTLENNSTDGASIILKGDSSKTLNLTFPQNDQVSCETIGCIVGKYSTSSQKSSLQISDLKVNYDNKVSPNKFGGIIGELDSTPTYVKLTNIDLKTESNSNIGPKNYLGGLIGFAPNAFIDVSGNISVNLNKATNGYGSGTGAGALVGAMGTDGGVLRLSGTADISKVMPQYEGVNNGVLVGRRNNALIYASGDWKLTRKTDGNYQDRFNDDIGDWGEVLHLDDKNLTEGENGLLTVDNVNHTVTVNGVKSDSSDVEINSLSDFAKTALTIQNYFGGKILKLSDGSVSGSDLLKDTLNINSDIDLTNTGITGLMRDSNISVENYTNVPFTGIINGNKNHLTLAVGQMYGVNCKENVRNQGKIVRHNYNGLLAMTNDATVKDLTINGTINVIGADAKDEKDGVYIGAIAAKNLGDLKVENVNIETAINVGEANSRVKKHIYVGGAVGYSTAGDISFKNCTSSVSIISKLPSEEAQYNCDFYGSLIGSINTTNSQTITFDTVTVGGRLENTIQTYNANVGGLIAEIKADNKSPENNVIIKNVTVDGLTINSNSEGIRKQNNIEYTGNSGGFLGHGWYKTNVTFDSLTVKNSHMTVSGNNVFMAGLVYSASGYWNVKSVKFEGSNSIEGTGTSDNFGMLVNKACRVKNIQDRPIDETDNSEYDNGALYLEITGDYTISKDTKITLDSPKVFDEIAAFSTNDKGSGASGQALISIPAKNSQGDAEVIMDGTDCNTYQNQTTSADGTAWEGNPNTRYYYNLDTIRAKDKSDLTEPEELFMWSVYKYSAVNIQTYFSKFSSFGFQGAGNYDMKGLSYYPIDEGSPWVGGAFKFYNKEIETAESGNDNSDSYSRHTSGSSDNHTQHYLMHHGLFRNVSGNIKISLSLTLSGSVGKTDNGSGAIICGKLCAGTSSAPTEFTVYDNQRIILKDLYVYGANDSDYAPLLINRLEAYSNMTMQNVLTDKAGSSYNMGGQDYAATSLIGYVGGEDKSDLTLNFSSIKLDARKNADGNTSLDKAYGTTRSIFKNATLLEKFTYTGVGSSGVYNYSSSDDWTDEKHNVTYGYEVSNSVDNEGMEQRYYKEDIYTSPEKNNADSPYDFSDYIPYVHISSATVKDGSISENVHELDVNVSRPMLTKGCGTYNDPYIVTGPELQEAARIISTQSFDENWKLNYKVYNTYCDKTSHVAYTYDSTSNKFVGTNNSTLSTDDVIKHLCSAYYKVEENITLGKLFVGLGGSAKAYGFRGVIVGGDNVTITNNSQSPLIRNSNGSVVKDLNIVNTQNSALSCDSNMLFDYSSANSCPYYGGVIGQIFGGDNIIDNVTVENKKITVSGKYDNLVPVGGYVGVVIYGGLYFRNMDGKTGLTEANTSKISDNNYLYENPYIGRVLDGFAIEEGTEFKQSSLNNGEKNYIIMELNQNADDEEKLYPEAGTSILHIPNAQALYVLGAISKDGTYMAQDNGNPGYAVSMMTHNALYNNIGNCTSASDEDFVNASVDNQETYNNSPKYTNIVKRYTRKYGSKYQAKLLNNNKYQFELNGSTDYDLSNAGFKGINQLYNHSDSTNKLGIPKLLGFDGNNKNIKFNINVNVYKDDNYPVIDGVGLFNRLNYIPKENNITIKVNNVTLSGSVNYKLFLKDTTTSTSKSVYTGGFAGNFLPNSSVTLDAENIGLKDIKVQGDATISGGFIGYSVSSISAKNVTLKNVSVVNENASACGGFIGSLDSSNSLFEINGISSTGVTAEAVDFVGGVIGKFSGSKFTIKGSENENADFVIGHLKDNVDLTKSDLYYTPANYGAGGIVGQLICTGENVISNLSVKGKDSDSYIGNSTIIASAAAGGIVGSVPLYKYPINVNNCNASINVYGGIAGGIMGIYGVDDISKHLEMTNCYFGKNSDSSSKFTIQGNHTAGGLVGFSRIAINVNECGVENANIKNVVVNRDRDYNFYNVGGIAGHCSENGGVTISNILNNIYVKNCLLEGSANWTISQLGGLIGNTGWSQGDHTGYNILLKNISFKSYSSNEYMGNLIGRSGRYGSQHNKFVAVTKQGTGFVAEDFGRNSSGNLASGYYAVMADYNGKCESENANKDNGTFPYVNINPKVEIGGLELFGDSVEFESDGTSTAQKVIDEAEKGSKQTAYKSKNIQTYAADFNQNYKSKLTDFDSVSDLPKNVQNFPVLLIDDNKPNSITGLLTDYISVITNNDMAGTKGDSTWRSFVLGNAAEMKITSYAYDETAGKFVDTKDPSLEYNSSSQIFNVKHGKYDNENGKSKFTLITLSYYDPNDSSKTVMELDIPVFVKKVLDFSFESKVLSGTSYHAKDYENANPTAYESFGQPITTYFTYKYYRTAEEWEQALNSGENLCDNFKKNLYLFGDSIESGILPNGTKLTLVDRNNNDKSYSAEITDESTFFNRTNGKLELSGIDNFNPLTLNDLLMKYADVSAEKSEEGTMVETDEETATACAYVGGVKKYFRPAEDTDTADLYTISVTAKDTKAEQIVVSEDYYLTIITPETDENKVLKNYIRYYTSENKHLDGSLPTNDIGENSDMSTYIIGNFFEQTVSVTANNAEVIDTANKYINATLTANIKLNSNLASTFRGYNDSNGKLFHAFQMRLQKFENNSQTGSNTSIVGGTSVSVDLSLSSKNGTVTNPSIHEVLSSSSDFYTIKYPESIWDDLKNSDDNGVTINANVNLTYDDELIKSQFPEKTDDDDTRTGVAVLTSSNISYTESNVENSSITLLSSPTDKHYYRRNITSAKLDYNVLSTGMTDVNAQLGVNPIDTNEDSALITAQGTYDVSDLKNKEEAKKVQYTLSLYKKNNEGKYETVAIDDYLTDIKIYDESSQIISDGSNSHTYTVGYENDKDKYSVITNFNVKTGTEFESQNYDYANYKVVLKAKLLDESGNEVNNSTASDYIIYTNAKIDPSFVK